MQRHGEEADPELIGDEAALESAGDGGAALESAGEGAALESAGDGGAALESAGEGAALETETPERDPALHNPPAAAPSPAAAPDLADDRVDSDRADGH